MDKLFNLIHSNSSINISSKSFADEYEYNATYFLETFYKRFDETYDNTTDAYKSAIIKINALANYLKEQLETGVVSITHTFTEADDLEFRGAMKFIVNSIYESTVSGALTGLFVAGTAFINDGTRFTAVISASEHDFGNNTYAPQLALQIRKRT